MSTKKKTLLGVFLVGGVVLFSVGLFLIGSRKQIFSRHFTVYTETSKMDSLETGASVLVAGMNAGQIKAIDIPKNPSQRFRLTLEIDEKFHPIVREDSSTSIETAGMVGSKYLAVTQGSSNSPECPPGGTLPNKQPQDMSDLMRQGSEIATDVQSTIKDLHKNADETLQTFTAVARNVNGTIRATRGNVEQIAANAAHLTADASQITASVKQGHGVAGEVLSDQKLAADVATTVANAKQTSANVEKASETANAIATNIQRSDLPEIHQTLANTRDMTGQMDQAVGTFLSKGNNNVETAVALRNTVQEAQQAATNVSDDTEALKHNFFLRGFFHRRGVYSFSELTPSKYENSEFVRSPRARVWIPAAGMFKTDEAGAQELTDTGRYIVDRSVADIVPFLPNNPVVVEGYAEDGLPDQRYIESRQRAADVQHYLESHLHLRPELVGIMPLGDRPPAKTGKSSWDGICIALVVSK